MARLRGLLGRGHVLISIAAATVPMIVTVRAVAPQAVAIPLPVSIVAPIPPPVPTWVHAAREAGTKRKNGHPRQHGLHRYSHGEDTSFHATRKLGELRA